jgi:hypothetical protein
MEGMAMETTNLFVVIKYQLSPVLGNNRINIEKGMDVSKILNKPAQVEVHVQQLSQNLFGSRNLEDQKKTKPQHQQTLL